MRVFVVALAACLATVTAERAVAQTAAPPALSSESAAKIARMLESTGLTYSKVAPTSWFLTWEGDHNPEVPVYIFGSDRGVSVVAVIVNSSEVLNHAELARQLLRLNGERPVHFSLDADDDYIVELYADLASLDETSFTSMLTEVAHEADAAFETVKAFVSGTASAIPTGTFTTPPGSTAELALLSGRAVVAYDPAKWKQKPANDAGRYEFGHARGDGYAVVVAERLEIPTDALRTIAEANIAKSGGTVDSVAESVRIVNGSTVLMLEIDATVLGIKMTYLGYFFGGPAGTIQVFTFTGRNLVPEFRRDFEDFLNGLTVK